MKAKRIAVALLMGFTAVSLAAAIVQDVRSAGGEPAEQGGTGPAAAGGAEQSPQPKRSHYIQAYYLHGNKRCATCEKLERYSRSAVEEGFAEELADGRLAWSVLNMDEPEHQHFVQDYDLFAQSVVVVEVRDGDEVRWKNLLDVWELVVDQAAFERYVRDEIRAYLADLNEEGA